MVAHSYIYRHCIEKGLSILTANSVIDLLIVLANYPLDPYVMASWPLLGGLRESRRYIC